MKPINYHLSLLLSILLISANLAVDPTSSSSSSSTWANLPVSSQKNDDYAMKKHEPDSTGGSNQSVLEEALKNLDSSTTGTATSTASDPNQHHHHQQNNFAPHRHHNKNTSSSISNQTVGGGGWTRNKPPENDELVVNTQNGYVRGKAFYLDHHLPRTSRPRSYPFGRKKYRVNAWLGIPYAEKPIENLRFKRPVPVKNWDGVKNATELPNSCYQLPDTVIDFWGINMWNPNTEMSEDCLYLNIWTPHPKPRNSPVMVWIYGGGFTSGTSTLKIYDPKILVSETNLIFVSIQYRVSIFGFLYLGHPDAPGNQGLVDQYLALKWVHNNIQFFGGDSTKITIFGESAGAVSVSLHLLSPLSANLFRNAIMESGTALADWAILTNNEALERYKGIVISLGCGGNVTQMIACVMKAEPRYAMERSDEHYYTQAMHGVAQFTFVPVVDSYFLEEEPLQLLNRGKFKKCPILLGANKDEGNWFFLYSFPEYRNLTAPPLLDYETFKDFITSIFYFYPQFPSISNNAILEAVKYRYTNWNNAHNYKSNFENLDEAAGDFHFLCPVIDFANIYAMNKLDVFFYHYTQRSSRHWFPEWMGVMHGDEISFVFGEPLYPENNYTYNEKVLSRKMLKYWSNFVRFENPNGPVGSSGESGAVDDSLGGVNYINEFKAANGYITQTFSQYIETWPKYRILNNQYDDYQRAYFTLNSENSDVNYNLRAEYCTFWGSFLPKLILGESRCDCGASCLKNIDPSKLLHLNQSSRGTTVSVFSIFTCLLLFTGILGYSLGYLL